MLLLEESDLDAFRMGTTMQLHDTSEDLPATPAAQIIPTPTARAVQESPVHTIVLLYIPREALRQFLIKQ